MLSQDNNKLPRNISIVMDGNGRWALQRGLPRIKGHEEGAKIVKKITVEAAKLKLKELTLYSLSLDNLKRPQEEIS
ncbi:MAG: undecaprenyl diphosphate synthase family protein, partial [Planctomycetota bacterium]